MNKALPPILQRVSRALKDRLPASLRVARRARRSWSNGEPELRLLPQLCSRNRWSVDVGANNGVYTWYLARWSAGVTAFEPQPRHAALLARAFRTGVQIEQVALSDRPGEAVLRIPVAAFEDGRATIEPQNALRDFSFREYHVPCRCLDSYDLPRVGLIKIDVEGHELAVLHGARGLLARDLPHLVIEAEERHRPRAVESLCDFLLPFGYRLFACQDGGLSPLTLHAGEVVGNIHPVNFVFLARPLEIAAGHT